MTNLQQKAFRPGIALTICAILGLVVLIGLGTWQARKIGPKTELLTAIERGLSAEPSEMPVHLDDPSTMVYRRVFFAGEVLDKEPVRVFGTNLSGKAGYHLYLPIRHQYGRVVMVNFGWIPAHLETLPDLPRGETIEAKGVILANPVAGSFTPVNNPDRNEWYLADVFEMARHFGVDDFYHFRLALDDSERAGDTLPQGSQVRVDIPNDHFEYALTWYGLALGLIGVYVAFGFSRGRKRDQ